MKKLTPKEQELIEGLRNFRNSKHNPSDELELYLDQLYSELKDKATSDD